MTTSAAVPGLSTPCARFSKLLGRIFLDLLLYCNLILTWGTLLLDDRTSFRCCISCSTMRRICNSELAESCKWYDVRYRPSTAELEARISYRCFSLGISIDTFETRIFVILLRSCFLYPKSCLLVILSVKQNTSGQQSTLFYYRKYYGLSIYARLPETTAREGTSAN